MKRFLPLIFLISPLSFLTCPAGAQAGAQVTWDRHSLIIDGHRVCPVMGEIHYSRLLADEWSQEVRKMKEGGVTIIATYVFWNHVEEQEGIFRWDGQRSLRRFLEICKQESMPVVLRLGPFCHGEARNGGIPDWVFTKGCKTRDSNPMFLGFVEMLYRQIFTQVQGLQWKDGGTVIAAQFDNEYRGRGEYLMALKKIALDAGFDLPFYTRTGWPELATPVPFGEMLPLYGDYADGFWTAPLARRTATTTKRSTSRLSARRRPLLPSSWDSRRQRKTRATRTIPTSPASWVAVWRQPITVGLTSIPRMPTRWHS